MPIKTKQNTNCHTVGTPPADQSHLLYMKKTYALSRALATDGSMFPTGAPIFFPDMPNKVDPWVRKKKKKRLINASQAKPTKPNYVFNHLALCNH